MSRRWSDVTHTEYTVVNVRADGTLHMDEARFESFEAAAEPWNYHAEIFPDEIVTVVSRRVYVTSWL